MEKKLKGIEDLLQFLSIHIQRPLLCLNGDMDEAAYEEFRKSVVPALKEDGPKN